MPYIPTQCPAGVDQDGLRKWIEEEFLRIAQSTSVADGVTFKQLYAAPEHIVDGMVVYSAGGVLGGTAGLYERRAGAWVKL